jgi:hypothetical protein
MGRGRAKAKQQKVARDLKYNTHSTDLAALQRELTEHPEHHVVVVDDDETEDDDRWATGTR